MRTRYSQDQQAVAEVFGGLFAAEAASEAVRAAEAGCGFDPGLWRTLAAAGAAGMAVGVEHGGAGASLTDLAVVVFEWGRRIAPVPLVEHAVTARLIAALASNGAVDAELARSAATSDPPAANPTPHHTNHAETAHRAAGTDNTAASPAPHHVNLAELARAVAAGEMIATLSLRPADEHGLARLVPAGAVAHVVAALTGDTLVVAHNQPPGVSRPNTADLPLADRDLSGAAAASGHSAVQAWEAALAEWKALMAVAYAGLASEALSMGVAYTAQRHQFGVPVGSFQAVQHGLADAATRCEGARLLAFRAVCALDAGSPDGARLASMALLFGAESARFATDRVLQYHGGYGYSAEYDVQLYYRRAAGWLLQLGEPGAEIARLADAELGPKQAAA